MKFELLLVLIVMFFSLPIDKAQAKESPINFYTNVIDINEEKLTPEFWISKPESSSSLLLTTAQIQAINNEQFARQSYLMAPLSYQEVMAGDKIKKMINSFSKPPKSKRFFVDGTELSIKNYQSYQNNMALDSIKDEHKIRFALVTKRASLRTFPTVSRVLNSKMDSDLDRFQESAVFPGEALAVLHQSRDGEWLFVQNYHYRAWLKTEAVAFATKSQVQAFLDHEKRLVVTGAKVFTTFNPSNKATSEIQLDMGVSLPILAHSQYKEFLLAKHNPYTGHIVLFPTADSSGKLVLTPTLVPRSADVNIGFLPLTSENLIKQSFKFLGERYGWGHDYNARDCTGFVGEIYKSFGLLLPRNSGQQGEDNVGSNTRFAKSVPISQKSSALSSLNVGDLIYIPGHVAMFLGYDQGRPYIIHDVHGMGYIDNNGNKVSGKLNGVSVTPLLPFKSYLKNLYNIKRLR